MHSNSSKRRCEFQVYHQISKRPKTTSDRGRNNVRKMLDSFVVHGPHGEHIILVLEAAQMSLRDMRMLLPEDGFNEYFISGHYWAPASIGFPFLTFDLQIFLSMKLKVALNRHGIFLVTKHSSQYVMVTVVKWPMLLTLPSSLQRWDHLILDYWPGTRRHRLNSGMTRVSCPTLQSSWNMLQSPHQAVFNLLISFL